MDRNICAVVVTYNRRNLLIECLQALLNQSLPLSGICVVDNASTDGTEEMLLKNGFLSELPPRNLSQPWEKEFTIVNPRNLKEIRFHYLRMNKNSGGAGGFYEGIKRGYLNGYEWLWLMDDDAIPNLDALERLVEKLPKIANNIKIGFLCSKVVWTDGTSHIMNVPGVTNVINEVPFNAYDSENVLLVKSATFVSLLINRLVVEKLGLPIKDFFIWADDVEYTLRITKNGYVGIYVCDSIVVHKTKSNYSASTVQDWRFYYNVRNMLWVHKMHSGKVKYIYLFMTQLLRTFKLPRKLWFTNLKACFESFIKKPRIEHIQ